MIPAAMRPHRALRGCEMRKADMADQRGMKRMKSRVRKTRHAMRPAGTKSRMNAHARTGVDDNMRMGGRMMNDDRRGSGRRRKACGACQQQGSEENSIVHAHLF